MGFVINGKLRVYAYPKPNSTKPHTGSIPNGDCWPYHKFSADDVKRFVKRVRLVSPEYYILGYDDLNDLINQIVKLLNTQTWKSGTPPVTYHHPCLEVLEITSHANPARCGGICEDNISQFAAQMDSLTYCDELSIYLSGCNTGCRDPDSPGDPGIAEALAELLPSAKKHKQHRITVFGTKGYQTGSNAGKNSGVTRDEDENHPSGTPYLYSEDRKLPLKTMSTADDPTYRGFRGPNSA